MSFFDAINANKTKSLVLILGFFVFITLLAWVFAELTGFGAFGFGIAVFIAIILSIGSYYWSDSIVLKISGARPANAQENRVLINKVEQIAIAAGVPTPKIFVIEDTALNAFATGRDPQHAVICVTTGLLQRLDRNELEGVIAHEMSHIQNYDIRFMTIVTVMVGITALLSDFMLRSFLWGNNRDSNRSPWLIVIGLVLAVLSPLIATLIQLAVSRSREYLADANAVKLTRYPDGLISALKKLESDTEPLEAANKATAHLYIANPLKNTKGMWLKGWFQTHPSIESRVAALEKM
jgi:heat shock protein HtpX